MPNAIPTILRRTVRVVLPSLAFIPAGVVLLRSAGVLGDSVLFDASVVVLLPALSLSALVESFGGGTYALAVATLAALVWCTFIAYALHRVARLAMADDFSWAGFCGGLVLGAIPGALVGWRAWIRLHNSASLATCLVGGALIGGIALGLYMGSCWSKTRYE
jgi:hypothetical protein